jgi:hypothetical protein
MQNILDTRSVNRRQQLPVGAGNLPDTPSHPPAGSGDYQRQRDNDHPAATWCRDRSDFVQTTGPPPSACHLYP